MSLAGHSRIIFGPYWIVTLNILDIIYPCHIWCILNIYWRSNVWPRTTFHLSVVLLSVLALETYIAPSLRICIPDAATRYGSTNSSHIPYLWSQKLGIQTKSDGLQGLRWPTSIDNYVASLHLGRHEGMVHLSTWRPICKPVSDTLIYSWHLKVRASASTTGLKMQVTGAGYEENVEIQEGCSISWLPRLEFVKILQMLDFSPGTDSMTLNLIGFHGRSSFSKTSSQCRSSRSTTLRDY